MPEKRKRRRKIKRRELALPPTGYQPTKAELDEEVRLPATPTQLAKAMVQDVTINRADQRGS